MSINPGLIWIEKWLWVRPRHKFYKLVPVFAKTFNNLLVLEKYISNRLTPVNILFDAINRYSQRLSNLNNWWLNNNSCWLQNVRLTRYFQTLNQISFWGLNHAVVAEFWLAMSTFENGAKSVVFAPFTKIAHITIRFEKLHFHIWKIAWSRCKILCLANLVYASFFVNIWLRFLNFQQINNQWQLIQVWWFSHQNFILSLQDFESFSQLVDFRVLLFFDWLTMAFFMISFRSVFLN